MSDRLRLVLANGLNSYLTMNAKILFSAESSMN